MAKLVSVKLETNDWNPDGVAWFAYFEGEPTEDELDPERVFADRSLVEAASLGWDLDDDTPAEECPTDLSRRAGLRRYFVALAF